MSARPSPMSRMVELLAASKRDILAAGRRPTVADFDAAWDRAWGVMVDERAWPHLTELRRSWRTAMRFARPEACEAFVDVAGDGSPIWGAIADALDDVTARDGQEGSAVFVA